MLRRLFITPELKRGIIIHSGNHIRLNGLTDAWARSIFGGAVFESLTIEAGAEYETIAIQYVLSRVRKLVDREQWPAWVKDSRGRVEMVRNAVIQVPMLPAPEPLFGYTKRYTFSDCTVTVTITPKGFVAASDA